MYKIGIDIGYSSLKATILDAKDNIIYNKYLLHKGHIVNILKEILSEIKKKYGFERINFGGFTGNGSTSFTGEGKGMFVNEVSCVMEGSLFLNKDIKSIIQIGGETAKYIRNFSKAKGQLKLGTNTSCSAGTGSFLEEQVSRINMKLEDYSTCIDKAKSVPRIAGRCSVFAKTDITHYQQEGVPREDILLGVAYSVVKNYKGIVMKKMPVEEPVIFVGGTAHNKGIIRALREVLELEEKNLVIPEYFDSVESIGAALIGEKRGYEIDLAKILQRLQEETREKLPVAGVSLGRFGTGDSLNKHVCTPFFQEEKREVYLGIDIGSTSTNLVAIKNRKEIVAYEYIKTFGNPLEAVKNGLKKLKEKLGEDIEVLGVGVTGSGRGMIAKKIGADIVRDEITSQAKGAVTLDPEVDTIFEIGGQDSKYISIRKGEVEDFKMNKVCAAGTGSFIEEQSIKYGIPIEKFGQIALAGEEPSDLGERCTVFMEASVIANLSKGVSMNNIASGLCYSIVKNYLNRVVEKKPIGNRIFLQGGVGHNQGIINAFRVLTGKEIIIPPFFSVTGAYGIAAITSEEMAGKVSTFKGFDLNKTDQVFKEILEKEKDTSNTNLVDRVILSNFSQGNTLNKKRVGIPYALFLRGMIPLFGTFFRELGFEVVLSGITDERTIDLTQKHSIGETCFPIKLMVGHVASLIEKKVDYIFLPSLHTMGNMNSQSRKNYGCVYLQSLPRLIDKSFDMDKAGIKCLTPRIDAHSKESMKELFFDLGRNLEKSHNEIQGALKKAMEEKARFERKMKSESMKAIKGISGNEKVFVIISKPYVTLDPVLNLGIEKLIRDRGYKVIPSYQLPGMSIEAEHSNMYWAVGKHMLEAGKAVEKGPNMYPILITNNSCGPDSLCQHYFKELMGEKPYLTIESDEHSSKVGVVTRVEAFINSIDKREAQLAEDMSFYLESQEESKTKEKREDIIERINKLDSEKTLLLPHIFPYAHILKAILERDGMKVEVLPKTSQRSITLGDSVITGQESYPVRAIVGDCLLHLEENPNGNEKIFFVPQSEGAEVSGQYGRFLRAKLDEKDMRKTGIFSPFLEDIILEENVFSEEFFMALLAGDIVNLAPIALRQEYLAAVYRLIGAGRLTTDELLRLSEEIYSVLKAEEGGKKIMALGDPYILFNEFMNDSTFRQLEERGHRIHYSPLSEYFWVFWSSFNRQTQYRRKEREKKLEELKGDICLISKAFKEETPFEADMEKLMERGRGVIGHLSGGNGVYRQGKVMTEVEGIKGIITAASTYENTDILLDIVNRENNTDKPLIKLNFDKGSSKVNKLKLESFIYYI